MKINCSHAEVLPLHKIIPNPKNPNKHPPEQIERLARLIDYQGQRHPIIVSRRSGFVVVGHGRLEAIKKLGWAQAAVDFQDFENEAQEYAFVVSDNAIAEWADLDLGAINSEMLELGPDFDIDLLGLDGFKLDLSENGELDENYTRKVEAPIYEPTGEKPTLAQLYDTEYTDELIREIDSLEVLGPEEKIFLKMAAHRHSKFNYKNIAEYYAHAPEVVKKLMERSALVIIDFDQAIELGFVKLTKEMSEIVGE